MNRSLFIGLGVLFGSVLGVQTALSHVPQYVNFELQARSNLCVNEPQGFNLPCNVFFNSSTASINDSGEVAIKLNTNPANNKQGIWFGAQGNGGIAFESLFDAFLGDVSLNNAGYAVFQQTLSSQNGIYFYDSVTTNGGLRSSQPFGSNSWGVPIVNNLSQVGFRASFSNGQAFYSLVGSSSLALHAVEANLDPGSPYSFLFTPSFNDFRQIAAKVRIGAAGQTGNSQPDEIRIFNSDGSSVLIAQDTDALPGSAFTGFDNSVAINNSSQVAFIATLSGGGRGVFLGAPNQSAIPIASTHMAEVNEIEFFAPAVNDHSLVAFRGRDSNGRQAVFVGDGAVLRRVIGNLDQVATDLGTAQIAQHDNSTVFGGGVGINIRGDIVFQCALAPAKNNQVEWGSGVFIAYSDLNPADINADGAVNVNDLLAVINGWGPCPALPQSCFADVNNDGHINVNDLLMVINNWG